jgi:hypothetical protein
LEEKKSKELNKFLVYLHDNKKCWPKWAKANQINPNYFTQAFIYWDGRIDSPIKY